MFGPPVSRRNLFRATAGSVGLWAVRPFPVVHARRLQASPDANDSMIVAGLDAANTGVLPGPVPDGMPELVETFFPDLSFRRPRGTHAGLQAVGPAIYAYALGPGTPVIEANIRTGASRIMFEDKASVLGATGDHLFAYTGPTETSPGIIEAEELQGAGRWAVDGEPRTRAAIVDDLMVTAEETRLVARSVTNGEEAWSTDTDPGSVRFLASDADVVIGLDELPGGLLQAWNLAEGSLLWEISVDVDGFDRFSSEPVVHDSRVLISTPSDLLIIDPLSGAVHHRIEYGEVLPRQVEVRSKDGIVLVRDNTQLRAFDLVSGEKRWSYRPLEGLYAGLRTAGSLVFVLVSNIDIEGTSFILEAIDLESGEPRFELPSRDEGHAFSVADYIVTDGAIVLAGDAGLRVYRGSGEPYAGITSPVSGNSFTSETYGFRYEWDEGWEVTGTSFMTNEGISLFHPDSGAVAAQYVTDRDLAMDEELGGLVVRYPVLFGPDTRYLRGMEQLDAPDLSAHVPLPHETMLGRFETTFNPPFHVTLCLTVSIPLDGGKNLVFEFMTAESQFDDDLALFWTFFENLEIT